MAVAAETEPFSESATDDVDPISAAAGVMLHDDGGWKGVAMRLLRTR
jgi:hypothetical protein